MTPAQRKTLRAVVRQAEMITENYPGLIVVPNVGIGPEELDALRAALIERTCGTCVHYYGDRCTNLDQRQYALDMPPDDGCIKGYQPRDGES